MQRRRRKSREYLLVGLLVFVAVFLFGFLAQRFQKINQSADAASLANFDAGYIISDYQMSNYNSMSEADIQRFLTSQNSCGNTDYNYYVQLSKNGNYKWHFENGHFVCLSEERFGDTDGEIGSGETAAHIIWSAAQYYRINPQVLIVLLQKETGLITDPIPNDGDYRKATGYGCPDTAACSSKYYGFKNQVWNAAWLFRDVLDNGYSRFEGNKYVAYYKNPTHNGVECGGSVVNIRNRATAALYRYTPYQPNAAALAAGKGGGVTCGAYGNRNFYIYFEDWFGGITNEYSVKLGRTIPDGTYQITAKNDNSRAFDVYGGVYAGMDSEKVILYGAKNANVQRDNQKFEVVYNERSGYYNIYNKTAGLYLTMSGESLRIEKRSEVCGQNWNIGRDADGYYTLTSACTGQVVTLASQSEIKMVNNADNNSKWKFYEVSGKTNTLADGSYQIVTALSNKYALDIKGGVTKYTASGETNIWSKRSGTEDQTNQTFDVKYNSDMGYYVITNHVSGLSLDVYNGDKEDGTKIIAWRRNSGCNQQWMIKETDGGYEILSMCSGKAMDVSRGKAQSGQDVILYTRQGSTNQKWNFEKIQNPANGKDELTGSYYLVTSKDSNEVLDIKGGLTANMTSADAIIYGKKKYGGENQIFRFKKDEKNGGYYIYNQTSGLYLDVTGGGIANETRVIWWPYNGACNQRWNVKSTNDGYYNIVSACSGKVLDVYSGVIASNKPIIIFTAHGGYNQKWAIVEKAN